MCGTGEETDCRYTVLRARAREGPRRGGRRPDESAAARHWAERHTQTEQTTVHLATRHERAGWRLATPLKYKERI